MNIKFTRNRIIVLLLIILLLWLVVTVIKSSKGIAWITTINAPTIKTEVYSLEMAGYNGRVYTFVKDNKDCMVIATSEGVGLSCIPSTTNAQKPIAINHRD